MVWVMLPYRMLKAVSFFLLVVEIIQTLNTDRKVSLKPKYHEIFFFYFSKSISEGLYPINLIRSRYTFYLIH